MDTSETYIKMCEKAGEIQRGKHYPKTMGQKIIFWENDVFAQISLLSINWKIVWLPRQDQLQAILDYSLAPLGMLWKFYYTVYGKETDEDKREYWCIFDSMEQLWLAFVMKEKFNKIWNGEDWI